MQELGHEPTSEEIAQRMDIPVSKVGKLRKIAQEPIALETPIGEEEDGRLVDFIEDRQEVSPAEVVINLNLQEQTENLLRTLTPREEEVIKMRFGVGGRKRAHAGGGRAEFRGHTRTDPPDRGQGAAQATTMSDNILIRIDEGLADVQRMLARVHADLQVVKHDIKEFRNLRLNRTIRRTVELTSDDSSLKSGESHELTRRK